MHRIAFHMWTKRENPNNFISFIQIATVYSVLVNKPPKIVHLMEGRNSNSMFVYFTSQCMTVYDGFLCGFCADPTISKASELDVLCCSFSWMLFIPYLLIIKRTQKFCVGDDVRWEHNHFKKRLMVWDAPRPGIHFTWYTMQNVSVGGFFAFQFSQTWTLSM